MRSFGSVVRTEFSLHHGVPCFTKKRIVKKRYQDQIVFYRGTVLRETHEQWFSNLFSKKLCVCVMKLCQPIVQAEKSDWLGHESEPTVATRIERSLSKSMGKTPHVIFILWGLSRHFTRHELIGLSRNWEPDIHCFQHSLLVQNPPITLSEIRLTFSFLAFHLCFPRNQLRKSSLLNKSKIIWIGKKVHLAEAIFDSLVEG